MKELFEIAVLVATVGFTIGLFLAAIATPFLLLAKLIFG